LKRSLANERVRQHECQKSERPTDQNADALTRGVAPGGLSAPYPETDLMGR
jgi:hypothetical protein